MGTQNFYQEAKAVQEFAKILDPNVSVDAPKEWWLVLTDIRGSTKAVAEGRYRDVNLIGAASITSMINESQPTWIPFVFGGDGATALIPPYCKDKVQKSLQGLMAFAEDNYQLELRVGFVPLQDIYAQNEQVRVVKYELHEHSFIAMLLGRGVPLAEKWVKDGKYQIQKDSNLIPDLKGLSCRWQPIPTRKGVTLTLLIAAQDSAQNSLVLQSILRQLTAILGGDIKTANPVHLGGLKAKVLSQQLLKEAFLSGKGFLALLKFFKLRTMLSLLRILIGLKLAPVVKGYNEYRQSLTVLADYKKFDDVLRMVVDCTPEEFEAIEKLLKVKFTEQEIFYGFQKAEQALMTCLILPPNNQNPHIHFIDGADGGYTLAAKMLKSQMAEAKNK
jgi:hypothetical protein